MNIILDSLKIVRTRRRCTEFGFKPSLEDLCSRVKHCNDNDYFIEQLNTFVFEVNC